MRVSAAKIPSSKRPLKSPIGASKYPTEPLQSAAMVSVSAFLASIFDSIRSLSSPDRARQIRLLPEYGDRDATCCQEESLPFYRRNIDSLLCEFLRG